MAAQFRGRAMFHDRLERLQARDHSNFLWLVFAAFCPLALRHNSLLNRLPFHHGRRLRAKPSMQLPLTACWDRVCWCASVQTIGLLGGEARAFPAMRLRGLCICIVVGPFLRSHVGRDATRVTGSGSSPLL